MKRRNQRFSSRLRRAHLLISSGDPQSALPDLDHILRLCPSSDPALRLKSTALLSLRRFKDVVDLLHEFLPSAAHSFAASPDSSSRERSGLLASSTSLRSSSSYCFPDSLLFGCRKGSGGGLDAAGEQMWWRYVVLGQACYHLGMLEDATILLQHSKKSASDASRRFSNAMRDDDFCSSGADQRHHADLKLELALRMDPYADSSVVNAMISHIKLLLRRRSAAAAALEAGLYAESVRHLSKIVEKQKAAAPPWFLADCYLYRAIAYQALGKVVDAIADCNKNLVLNPKCTMALSLRASLHEMVKSFTECLLDLQQLKMVLEASLRIAAFSGNIGGSAAGGGGVNAAASIEYVNDKITAIRRKLTPSAGGSAALDAAAVLELPERCTAAEVEKAYLLLSLKHSPDKATLFLDHCVLHSGVDAELAKEEATASAVRLSKLIRNAHTKLISAICQQEMEEQRELRRRTVRRSCEGAGSGEEGTTAGGDVSNEAAGGAAAGGDKDVRAAAVAVEEAMKLNGDGVAAAAVAVEEAMNLNGDGVAAAAAAAAERRQRRRNQRGGGGGAAGRPWKLPHAQSVSVA